MLCPSSNCRSSRSATFIFPESKITRTRASASLRHYSDFCKDTKTPKALHPPPLTKDPFQINGCPGGPRSPVPCTGLRALTDAKVRGRRESSRCTGREMDYFGGSRTPFSPASLCLPLPFGPLLGRPLSPGIRVRRRLQGRLVKSGL